MMAVVMSAKCQFRTYAPQQNGPFIRIIRWRARAARGHARVPTAPGHVRDTRWRKVSCARQTAGLRAEVERKGSHERLLLCFLDLLS
jgi:hypothetical protein